MNAMSSSGPFVSLTALISQRVPSVTAGRRFDPLQGEHFPADQLQLGESFTAIPWIRQQAADRLHSASTPRRVGLFLSQHYALATGCGLFDGQNDLQCVQPFAPADQRRFFITDHLAELPDL